MSEDDEGVGGLGHEEFVPRGLGFDLVSVGKEGGVEDGKEDEVEAKGGEGEGVVSEAD